MDWIVFSVYRYFLLPSVFALSKLLSSLQIKNKFFETLHFRLKNEFHYKPTFDPKKKSIAVHAASGEIEYALPLIRKIKQLHPDYNIVVTLSSTSVLKSVLSQNDVDVVGPAPIDQPAQVKQFLNRFNFKVFLFARTDVWPEISFQLTQAKIPSFLFSATFSDASAKKNPLAHSLARTAFQGLRKILAVSETDKLNLEKTKTKTPVLVTGDTRFDQVFHKRESTVKDLPPIPTSKRVLVAGSTWIEDENIVLSAFTKKTQDWRLIIAPHEIHDQVLSRLENFFSQNNLKTVRLSHLLTHSSDQDWQVLVVDLYGYLFYLYAFADLAFVGGSFKAKVHSVMEPLSFLKPVCVGPYYKNNREAVEFNKIQMNFINTQWVQEIQSSNDLENVMSLHTKIPPSEKEKLARDLESLLNLHRGATDRTYKEISFLL